jgi:hypothetical protein
MTLKRRASSARICLMISRNNHGGEIDPVHVGLGGKGTGDIGLAYDSFANQEVDQAALAVEAVSGAFDLLARNQPALLQNFQDVIFALLHDQWKTTTSLA